MVGSSPAMLLLLLLLLALLVEPMRILTSCVTSEVYKGSDGDMMDMIVRKIKRATSEWVPLLSRTDDSPAFMLAFPCAQHSSS